MLLLGPRVLPWLLRQVARTGSRELFTLAVLALAVGIAFGSAELFGVSFALGAFFAGDGAARVGPLSQRAAPNSLPLQDAFAVLFFVSVGMLFDPSILVREPLTRRWPCWLIILVGKSLAALAIVLAPRLPAQHRADGLGGLAQIGEFSFILAGARHRLGLLPTEGLSLILAGAMLSITLNPLTFSASTGSRAGFDAARAAAGASTSARREDRLLRAELDAAQRARRAEGRPPPDALARGARRALPAVRRLTPEQREVVILHFLPQSAEPGERIIRKGDKADAAYFISSGDVEVAVAGRADPPRPGRASSARWR